MLKKLQERWGVSGWQFFMIMLVFAINGTFTAWVSKQITIWLDISSYSFGWWALKIFILLIGYQVFLLIFAFLLGQFAFFWKYEKKILTRMRILPKDKKVFRLAIFASGAGSNARKIIEYFTGNASVKIELVVCNKPGAGVIAIAEQNNIDVLLINRDNFIDGISLTEELKLKEIDMIILAGFLWQLPSALVKAFPKKIINIHPALLPAYGGKGMYGANVHKAVIENKESHSGITIHYVDEIYDNGEVIFQEKCMVEDTDTPDSLALRVHELEHRHFANVIHSIIKKQMRR